MLILLLVLALSSVEARRRPSLLSPVQAAHIGPRRHLSNGPPPCSAVAAFVSEAAEEARIAFNVTGLSVGVICNHSVAFAGGFGLADKAAGRKATADSLYQVASNSKAFTATIALQLEEEGKLSLDAPLREANPAFRFLDKAGNEDLALRDLLSHRTGLPRHDDVTFGSPTRAKLMEAMAWLELDKPVRWQPGEYNNMMLAAAGVAEEAVTGQQWEELVTERIFRRLNMSSSYANWSSVPASAGPFIAQPYRDGGQPQERTNADVAAPCGGIVSSVTDFVKWQAMHLRQAARACRRQDGGSPFVQGPFTTIQCRSPHSAVAGAQDSDEDKDAPYLLSDDQWAKLLVPNTLFPDFNAFGSYTLGLWFEQYGEEFLLHHAGDLAGMASKQAMLPLLGHSVVVLSNENESPARFVILLRILDFMLGLEPPKPPLGWQQRYLAAEQANRAADMRADAQRRARVTALPAASREPRWPLVDYCGSFVHPAYGNATISISNGGATREGWLQVCGAATIVSAGESQPAVPACASLFHLGYDEFAVGVRGLPQLRAGTNTATFVTGHGRQKWGVTSLTVDLEEKVDPIVFTNANYATKAQGYAWPRS